MKQCTKCKKNKELGDFPKNKQSKDGKRPDCKKCNSLRNKNHYIKNKKRILFQMAAYYEKNKQEILPKRMIYYKENKQEIMTEQAIYYEENRQKILIQQIEYRRNNNKEVSAQKASYKRQNSGKVNALKAKRRAAQAQRTPKWLTSEDYKKIESFYIDAARLTKETGIPHHVDHIIPLQGKNVSGLHVPDNLQVLIGSGPDGNCSKGSKFDL